MTIDDLIAACNEDGDGWIVDGRDTAAIRRVLEAVREDLYNSEYYFCDIERKDGRCLFPAESTATCPKCPVNYFAATRAALEQLK